jgi:hypothetical protein
MTDAPSQATGVAEGVLPDVRTDVVRLGWREWVALPELGLPAIKAKIDTGARTSSLHAFDIVEHTDEHGSSYVSFKSQPVQRNESIVIACRAPVVDKRRVTDSGGHAAERYVVKTRLDFGPFQRDVELTLTDRRGMLFRMLVGRTSLVPDVVTDSAASFLLGRKKARDHYSSDDKTGS